mmetsp:Transcript_17683/g.29889  ORF Transcript_17683/g.29889 Transcript_17683/m.29889 type:complete len:149 (+) Transcript_17683:927-1373(+)
MMPVFCAAMMNLFEGNQQILNIYAEVDKPQQFFYIVVVLFVVLLVFIAILVGVLGYLAFGNTVESVIIYNLPNSDFLSVLAKVCYVVTITGSYVIVIQPIFYVIEGSNFYKTLKVKLDCEDIKLDLSSSQGSIITLNEEEVQQEPVES